MPALTRTQREAGGPGAYLCKWIRTSESENQRFKNHWPLLFYHTSPSAPRPNPFTPPSLPLPFPLLRLAVGEGQPVLEHLELVLPLAAAQVRLELLLPGGGEQRLQVAHAQPLADQLLLQEFRLGAHVLQLPQHLRSKVTEVKDIYGLQRIPQHCTAPYVSL